MATPRLNLPQMADGEGSGYVTFNDLGRVLEALLQPSMTTITATDPPVSPSEGQLFIVPTGGTGAWAGQDGKVAQWYNTLWYFYDVPTGFDIHDQENNLRWTQGKADPYLGHVSIGHVGLVLDDPGTATLPSLPATTPGAKLTSFDAKIQPEVDAAASITNSTIQFSEPGLWLIACDIIFTVASSSANSVREWEAFFYNETDGVEVGILNHACIARYQATTSVSGTFPAIVTNAMVAKEYSIRLRSIIGGAITPISVEDVTFLVTRISHSNIEPSIVTSD